MSKNVVTSAEFFHPARQEAPLALIACPGSEELANLIDHHLVNWGKEVGMQKDTFLVGCDCPRFQSGDAKGLVKESVRGYDVFLVVDPGNYALTYNLFGHENHMSPDDHFSNLKRLIQAVAGRAHRVSVIMPSLYGGRQHRRMVRESLDCAVALQELQAMGVKNIITFDAHDPRVQNAIPLKGFETVTPMYQFIKYLLKEEKELEIDSEHMMVISPDEGGMSRAVKYSNVLGLDMGMFYKRRDYTRVVNGRNPIVAHARKVFVCATFGLFTGGLKKFDEYYENGLIDRVLTTNLVYQTPDLLAKPYYINVDMSKYIALIIDNLNHDSSLHELLNPIGRINKLLAKYRAGIRE